ncbi:HAD family phosphatase [Bradyrhizobium liaoningense]|uniref:HAD family hydrolase n=1 Tax=Bradyrhizobium liaoningense TaxID=43992 RepID=UPI001BA6D76D|nr:HAD family hydrolase [Bradyrhizobium liaoningense]MBR0907191.1 haloacid dehalogenase-like hydrolase [Bradyrhizobium liaoningense]
MNDSSINRRTILASLLVSAATLSVSSRSARAQSDPLPSWNEGQPKKAILDFVTAVTKEGGPDFVPAPERIATFDNDGTLWCEQPMYVQLAFALDRVKALSAKHPEWKQKQPFKAVLDNDIAALAKAGEKGLVELVMATHAGMTTAEFEQLASEWIKTARHPKFNRPYTELVYQPMLELLGYLRTNGFKTFIVSGGGIEFMRPWSERVYGIPPEQVVGSSIKTQFKVDKDGPVLIRQPVIDLVDDGPGKPVGINSHIGRRPIAAFGNSDGDFQMLQWTTGARGRRLGLIVHHTDAEREYAYDRKSPFGKLDKGLDAASANGWVVVSMKDDWKRMFGFQ